MTTNSGVTWGEVDVPFPISNVVIVGGGDSLRGFDFSSLIGRAFIISVNDSWKHVPFADAWFTLDPWGFHGPQLPQNFTGKMYAAVPEDFGKDYARAKNHRLIPPTNVTYLHRLIGNNIHKSSIHWYKLGLSEDRSCINTGNSGYGAMNVAYHLRPKRIVLLGIDGGSSYFYTRESKPGDLSNLPILFESAKRQLDNAGIEVINGSLNSTVTSFVRMSPLDAVRELI